MCDEKILAKSIFSEKASFLFKIILSILFVFSLFCLTVSFFNNLTQSYSDINSKTKKIFSPDHWSTYYFFLSLLTYIAVFLLYSYFKIHRLTITDKNVIEQTLFRKEIILPIYKITAYSTGKALSQISVSTPTKRARFIFIRNCDELGLIIRDLINSRQEETKTTTKNVQQNNLDDIRKLRELLDNGIISQEEFEAKKKQLLSL